MDMDDVLHSFYVGTGWIYDKNNVNEVETKI